MKSLVHIAFFLILGFSGFSQLNLDAKENKKIEKDKFYYGGEFLVSFGDNGRILLSPASASLAERNSCKNKSGITYYRSMYQL